MDLKHLQPGHSPSDNAIPLVIDMDGTLLRTDSLWELTVHVLSTNPFLIFKLIFLALRGKAKFKAEIAQRCSSLPLLFPPNEQVIVLANEARAQRRQVILASGSNQLIVAKVAEQFGLFDSVMSSDEAINFVGKVKCQKLIDEFGEKGFDYVGNATADLDVWSHCRNAFVVGSNKLANHAKKKCASVSLIIHEPASIRTWFRAIRLHQWVKNVLIFVPMILAHHFQLITLFHAVVAFFSFSLCASSVYLINDLADLTADREHPTKRMRPLCSGQISIPAALVATLTCLGGGFLISLASTSAFILTLFAYFVSTLLYSMCLKRIVLLDTVVLGSLYCLRIYAGGAATSSYASYWLLILSFFIFWGLALIKRITELIKSQPDAKNISGRGYDGTDLITLHAITAGCCGCTILTLALYIGTETAKNMYRSPEVLILACPMIAYWFGRFILLANRGEIDDDPVSFILRDKTSHAVFSLIFLIYFFASFC